MQAIREIQTVEQGKVTVRLPQAFWGQQVEIIVLSERHLEQPPAWKKSLRGCLQSYAQPELISTEADAWAEAAGEKYASR
jgi:hypothetical protein